MVPVGNKDINGQPYLKRNYLYQLYHNYYNYYYRPRVMYGDKFMNLLIIIKLLTKTGNYLHYLFISNALSWHMIFGETFQHFFHQDSLLISEFKSKTPIVLLIFCWKFCKWFWSLFLFYLFLQLLEKLLSWSFCESAGIAEPMLMFLNLLMIYRYSV